VQDPFPKPCYLFALVAGDLVKKEDTYTTGSGKTVTLRIYTQPANINQVRHSLALQVHARQASWLAAAQQGCGGDNSPAV
jgi:aminopeptidase N